MRSGCSVFRAKDHEITCHQSDYCCYLAVAGRANDGKFHRGICHWVCSAGDLSPGAAERAIPAPLAQFIQVFLREFTLANFSVARAVLFQSRETLHPNFITYDVTGLSPLETLLLSYCITLTPGTTAVDLEDEGRTLIIHALDAHDPERVRGNIDTTLRKALLRCTRA
jgi:multisubunit Na+/H+ antiporter MnhE subunit